MILVRALSVPVYAAICLATVARADGPPMPSYDVPVFCAGHADPQACVKGEYYMRGKVAAEWMATPAAIRAECIAADRWQDYGVLDLCIGGHKLDAETGAAGPR